MLVGDADAAVSCSQIAVVIRVSAVNQKPAPPVVVGRQRIAANGMQTERWPLAVTPLGFHEATFNRATVSPRGRVAIASEWVAGGVARLSRCDAVGLAIAGAGKPLHFAVE